jgi:hypothetical protein
MYKDKEGAVGDNKDSGGIEVLDYIAPVDESNPIYNEMMAVENIKVEDVKNDIRMFNNVSNLFYGWQRMPTL